MGPKENPKTSISFFIFTNQYNLTMFTLSAGDLPILFILRSLCSIFSYFQRGFFNNPDQESQISCLSKKTKSMDVDPLHITEVASIETGKIKTLSKTVARWTIQPSCTTLPLPLRKKEGRKCGGC